MAIDINGPNYKAYQNISSTLSKGGIKGDANTSATNEILSQLETLPEDGKTFDLPNHCFVKVSPEGNDTYKILVHNEKGKENTFTV